MVEAEAQTRLGRMVASEEDPTIGAAELTELLDQARRPDPSGRIPTDSSWTPTWDLHYAAAEGWARKAGRAAGRYGATVDGSTFHRQHVINHCLLMEAHHRDRIGGTIIVEEFGDDTATGATANG